MMKKGGGKTNWRIDKSRKYVTYQLEICLPHVPSKKKRMEATYSKRLLIITQANMEGHVSYVISWEFCNLSQVYLTC
jgi:hypothetical protein